MLDKIILCHKINKFYTHMYDGFCPKWSVNDLNNKDTLRGILFDVNRTFKDYENRFADQLKKSIKAMLEV